MADAVRRGVPVETACQAAGIGERTFRQWLEIASLGGQRRDGANVTDSSYLVIDRFARLVAAAQADFEAARIESIARAAEQVNPKTGLTEWRAGAWLLNNHPRYRKKYRQEHVAQVESTVTHRHEDTLIARASDDELRSWAALELPPATTP